MASLIDTEELERRIAQATQDVEDAKLSLARAQNELKNLSIIRASALALEQGPDTSQLGLSEFLASVRQDPLRNFHMHGAGKIAPASIPDPWDLVLEGSPADGLETDAADGKKRIRSTDMVAKLVNDSPVPMTREAIREKFDQVYGFPATWQNPVNALNNAIVRAANNKQIVADGDIFMSSRVYDARVSQESRMENGDA